MKFLASIVSSKIDITGIKLINDFFCWCKHIKTILFYFESFEKKVNMKKFSLKVLHWLKSFTVQLKNKNI